MAIKRSPPKDIFNGMDGNAHHVDNVFALYAFFVEPSNKVSLILRERNLGIDIPLGSFLNLLSGWAPLLGEHVSPRNTKDGPLKATKFNWVILGNIPHSFPKDVPSSHGDDHIVSKDGPGILDTHRSNLGIASLGYHVRNIVFAGSKKKMRRVDAGRVVAPVKNPQTIWNPSKGFHIAETMRKLLFFVAKVTNTAKTVSLVVFRGSPNPAAVRPGFVYLDPITFIQHSVIMMLTHQKSSGQVYYR